MRLTKPLALGVQHRPFGSDRTHYLGLTVHAAFCLIDNRQLVAEVECLESVLPMLGQQPGLDGGIPKARAEFLVCGRAIAPAGTIATELPLTAQVGSVSKTIRAIGHRRWTGAGLGATAGFDALPCQWTTAWGGVDIGENPDGTGAKPVVALPYVPAPNFEYGDSPYQGPDHAGRAAGFGPRGIHVADRRKWLGRQRHYLEDAYPGLPDGFDFRFYNLAPEDQQRNGWWSGDEPFLLQHWHADRAEWRGVLPGIRARALIDHVEEEGLREIPLDLATVWFFPDQAIGILGFQGRTPIGRDDAGDVARLLVAAEGLDETPRPVDHYAEILDRRTSHPDAALNALDDRPLLPEGRTARFTRLEEGLARQPGAFRQARIRNKLLSGISEAQAQPDGTRAALEAMESRVRAAGEPIAPWDLPAVIGKTQQEDALVRAGTADRLRRLHTEMAPYMEKRARSDHSSTGETADTGLPIGSIIGEAPFQPATGKPAHGTRSSFSARIGGGGDALNADRLEQMLAGDAPPPMNRADARKPTPDELAFLRRSGPEGGAAVIRSLDLRGEDLRDVHWDGWRLEGVILDQANMAGARLEGVTFQDVSLVATQLPLSCCDDVIFENCAMEEVVLREARWRNVGITGGTLRGGKADGFSVENGALKGVDARTSSFSDAKLETTVFIECALDGALFVRTDMARCAFYRCEMRGSRFDSAKLDRTPFLFEPGQPAPKYWTRATLSQVLLRDADLSEADFSYASLRMTDLSGAILKSARLTGATAPGLRLARSDLRQAMADGADLRETFAPHARLEGADFYGAQLHMAYLGHTTRDALTRFDRAMLLTTNFHPRKEGDRHAR